MTAFLIVRIVEASPDSGVAPAVAAPGFLRECANYIDFGKYRNIAEMG
jgi:hypothetical protein